MPGKHFVPRSASCLLLLVAAACPEPAHLEQDWDALGTQARADLYTTTAEGAEEALREIQEAYRRVERSLSLREPHSELNRLNREAARGPYPIQDHDLYRCIKLAVEWARASDGAFDPTAGPLMRLHGLRDQTPSLPTEAEIAETLRHVGWRKLTMYPEARAIRFQEPGMELDLGGILEGYALEVGARSFARPGFQAGLLALGANLYAWRRPPGERSWKVPIRDPQDSELRIGSIELVDRALSVSGSIAALLDERAPPARHIVDVAIGRPAVTDLFAAVAIADSGADANAISTTLYVLGSQRGGGLLERTRRVEALLLVRGTQDPYLLVSASLKDRLVLDEAFAEKIGGRVRYLLPPLTLP